MFNLFEGVAIPELKLKPRSRPQSADMDHVIVTTGGNYAIYRYSRYTN